MKTSLVTAALAVAASVGVSHAQQPYAGSRISDVWQQVSSDPYAELPETPVSLDRIFRFFVDHLLIASRRTLDDGRDLLPWFEKLVHPNGICLAGTWTITEPTPYTGYFAQGAQGLIIARASTALSNTRRGWWRAFGFAGKIYPTTDFFHAQPLGTANFFTIEDLGGTLRDHFLDAENENDILLFTPTPEAASHAAVGALAAKDFAVADGTLDPTQPLVRQLYPIAELGGVPPEDAWAPRWMRIIGSPDVPRVLRDDFREELDVGNYPELRFDILVADVGTRLGPKLWEKIGEITIYESVASESCDHRLHFRHPRFRK